MEFGEDAALRAELAGADSKLEWSDRNGHLTARQLVQGKIHALRSCRVADRYGNRTATLQRLPVSARGSHDYIFVESIDRFAWQMG